MRNKLISVYFFLSIIFCSCSRSGNHNTLDSPTAGEITIVADEAYKPLVQIQIDTFMEIYNYAKINVRYLPEAEVFNQLLNNDSIRIAITARSLTAEEEQFLQNKKIIPRSLKVAEDAVALVVNNSNRDTALTYEHLKDIITGRISTWTQLDAAGLKDTISIVFDKSGSANARYLGERFLEGKSFPANIYATNSSEEVIDYVNSHPAALGIISVNWISDRDDSLAGEFLKKVNVVALAMPDTNKTASEFKKPYQAYIALKTYPLLRDVMIINREGRSGLGTGLASFIAGDKGQRLIRMSGLLPATMPVRIIQVN